MQKGKNSLALSVDDIVKATGGRLLSSGEGTKFTGVCTDSRDVLSGSIFIALKGEKTDGHSFIVSAVERGASLCVIEHITPEIDRVVRNNSCLILLVGNTLAALQDLARFYRDKFPHIKMVGVTGSCGKTTTKELTASILSKLGSTVCTKGNFNSEIGLPLSMFSIRSCHEYGVFEMGINHPGEMDSLVGVLHPQFGVVTNIGTAHIGILGNRNNIALEKGKLFSMNPDLVAGFVNENDEYASFMEKLCVGKCFERYGLSMISSLKLKGMDGAEFMFGSVPVKFPLVGKYNICNAMAAAAVGRYFGAADEQIKEALEGAGTMFGRGEHYECAGIEVMCDCYNANLESVEAVIDFASEQTSVANRVVYVLGSLLEQGSESDAIHGRIGKKLSSSKADAIFLFGKEMGVAYRELLAAGKKSFWTDEYSKLENAVVASVKQGDFVVVKGSRGMAMERIVEKLRERGR